MSCSDSSIASWLGRCREAKRNGYPNRRAAQPHYGFGAAAKYGAGTRCSASIARGWLPLSPSLSNPSWDPRYCVSDTKEGCLRSRVFLARARLQQRTPSEVRRGVLARENRGKSEARQEQPKRPSAKRMAVTRRLAMRGKESDQGRTATEEVSGLRRAVA